MLRRAIAAAALAGLLALTGHAAAAPPQSPPPAGTAAALPPPGGAGVTPSNAPELTRARVIAVAAGSAKARSWNDGRHVVRTTAAFDRQTRRWTVSSIDAENRIQAQVFVDDGNGAIAEVRTGPQVAWLMARGYKGAFGRSLTQPQIWIPLTLLFVIPFLRLRRLLSWRTLDLLVLVSFGISLIWFNRGEIFTSVPLQYPPLVYLGARLAWIGVARARRRAAPAAAVSGPPDAPERTRPALRSWCPTWLLVTLMLLAIGLRLGLNAFDSNVIDVGYAGVIGADRIEHGATPYGTFPSDCAQCDTYGPAAYLAYVPFEAAEPWHGRWDDLPAAHGAAVAFDLLAIAGLVMLGRRLSGWRLGAGLGLAWAAFPFTAYALESNSNDSLVAVFLIWGLVFLPRAGIRGAMLGLAVLTKFVPVLLVPLWSRHPFPRGSGGRRIPAYLAGLAAAAIGTGWVLLLDGSSGVRRFWSRTVGFQIDRDSPFSIWGQHPGLRPLQIALGALVCLAALWMLARPRRLDPLQLAAFSGALMIGAQLVMTHWFYLYIPWFLPFALVAMIPQWPEPVRPRVRPVVEVEAPPVPVPA
jgi:hypothetical protein